MSPTIRANQIVHYQRCNHSTRTKSQVSDAHRSPASSSKPPRHQHLIRNRPCKYVAQHFQHTKRLVLPQLCHPRHQQQRNPDKSCTSYDHPSRANAVNYCSREQSERQSDDQEPQQKSLRDLRATKSQRFHKRSIKNRKAIKNNPHHEKKIQKRRRNHPPSVKDPPCFAVCHARFIPFIDEPLRSFADSIAIPGVARSLEESPPPILAVSDFSHASG